MKGDFAVLCTGPSMSQAVADSVAGLQVVAVNNAYLLAPWAEALAASDLKWWLQYPDAMKFAGRRFSTARIAHVERVEGVRSSTCSGVLALHVAALLGARRVLLLGVDMRGGHYFGEYRKPLRNADPARHAEHAAQFEKFARAHPELEVLNGTSDSALKCFPNATVDEFRAA